MIVTREMQAKDYTEVMSLWQKSEHMLLRDADSKESITLYLAQNPGLSFVAIDESSSELIGAILVGTDGRRGYIQHLVVDSAYRGNGLGKKLLSLANDALKAQGIEKTHLFVNQDNDNAKLFYQSLGWQRRDEVRMYSLNLSENLNA